MKFHIVPGAGNGYRGLSFGLWLRRVRFIVGAVFVWAFVPGTEPKFLPFRLRFFASRKILNAK